MDPSKKAVSLSWAQAATDKTETHLRLLIETGLMLASERSPDVIVRKALDAGLRLTGATVGAFFYRQTGEDGETYLLSRYAGFDGPPGSAFPLTASFETAEHDAEIHRVDDLLESTEPSRMYRFGELSEGPSPVRSYLAVPVRRAGDLLGGLFYGHPQPGVFMQESEDLVVMVASQAAVAIDNARLAENVAREIAVADLARQLQRETADRLTQVLESTSDGVALLDRNWRFTYINRYANELVAPGRRLVGVGFWDLFPKDVGSVFHQRYSEAMDNGRAVEFTERYEPLKMWAYVRVFPTPEGIAIFFQDVTRQRLSDQENEETAIRLRQALDAGHLGTWTWDKASDELDFDERAAGLFGVEPHQKMTRTEMRAAAVLPEDLALTPEKLQDGLQNREAYTAEYRIAVPGGGVRWIASTGLGTYKEGTREPTGMIGTVQDITARKEQEATLRQSEKLAATGRLAATIAHEINNPLEAVTNLIYLCKTDPTVPAPVQRLLETADGELARVAQIAQQTLGFYRDTTRPTEVDIAGLLSGVVDLFARKLLSKNLLCTLDVAQDLRILGLQGEIRQVFSNLLVNAIDASSSNTVIRIRGKNAAHGGVRGVSVLLADQGGGIPANVRERLFSPFFTTKQTIGTGLGLWVTRGIVEKHGGCIGFRTCTDTPSGTVFRIFLPTEPPKAEAFGPPLSGFLQ